MIAELIEISASRLNAQCDRNIIDLLRGKNFADVDFPGIQNLASQGQNCLIFTVSSLFGRPSGRISLYQK